MARSKLRRLSPEELAEKRKKQECFFCPEKYTPDHVCSKKGAFVLDMEEDAELAVLEEELASLYTPSQASQQHTP